MPATGFYEWKKSARRIPHYCHLRDDSFIAFAGLYDRWKRPDGTDLMSFTIVTTVPNALVSKLNSRMPGDPSEGGRGCMAGLRGAGQV